MSGSDVSVSVVIPTWRGAEHISLLLQSLWRQTLCPAEVIVIDSSSTDDTASIAAEAGCTVEVIPKAAFDHGATRNLAARMARGEILVFMTQDAAPAGADFLERLVQPIQQGKASAAYARQLPHPDTPPPEAFARGFNYPAGSHLKSLADLPRLRIKTFFFSNVASAIDREVFEQLGGFPEHVIMNEDMHFAAKLLMSGRKIAYQAEAKVFHSHDYRLGQQFKRNFDIGVSMAQARGWPRGASAGGEGVRFALGQLGFLLSRGHWRWVPRTLVELGLKHTAFQLGRQERWLPLGLKRVLSLHRQYWDTPR